MKTDSGFSSFLRAAIARLQEEPTAVTLFDLRYTLLAKLFPHQTFSVNQCSFSFFEDTLNLLTGATPFPPEKDQGSEYQRNYYKWIKSHQS